MLEEASLMEIPGAGEPAQPFGMGEERQRSFAEGLSKPERVLLVVRDALYGGSWEDLRQDLLDRKERKPFIFKLSARIEEDLERIAKLTAFEEAEGVDLRQVLETLQSSEEEFPL